LAWADCTRRMPSSPAQLGKSIKAASITASGSGVSTMLPLCPDAVASA
jgi:hypothetical protein